MVFRSPKQPSAVCRISVTHGFGLSRWAFACWSTVSSEIAVLKRPFWLELVDTIARNGRSGLNSSTVSRGIAVRGLDASTVWNGIAVRGLELAAVSRGIAVYALPAAWNCRQSRAESPFAARNWRQSRAESPFRSPRDASTRREAIGYGEGLRVLFLRDEPREFEWARTRACLLRPKSSAFVGASSVYGAAR